MLKRLVAIKTIFSIISVNSPYDDDNVAYFKNMRVVLPMLFALGVTYEEVMEANKLVMNEDQKKIISEIMIEFHKKCKLLDLDAPLPTADINPSDFEIN